MKSVCLQKLGSLQLMRTGISYGVITWIKIGLCDLSSCCIMILVVHHERRGRVLFIVAVVVVVKGC